MSVSDHIPLLIFLKSKADLAECLCILYQYFFSFKALLLNVGYKPLSQQAEPLLVYHLHPVVSSLGHSSFPPGSAPQGER